jgi:hypothetical protein
MSPPTEPGFQPVVFPCARCGQPAATFTLFPTGTGEDMWRERNYVQRVGFMGAVLHFETWPILSGLMAAIQRRDYQAINRTVGPDLIAFHCWECDSDYCEACWRIGPPEFDEDFPGFYDCTEGICPAGHTQVVDD